jgi:hypothetical protein
MKSSRRILLLQPPYGDLTYPYHSLSYVAAALRASGYDVDVLDLNAIWFRSLFTAATVRAWRNELQCEIDLLDARPALSLAEQGRFVALLQSIGICEALDPAAAITTFRTEAFYDFAQYQRAREQIRAFEKLLCRLYAPYDFFTAFAIPPYEPLAAGVVAKALASTRLIDDLRRILAERTSQHDYLFCGVTIPFSANLVPGLATLAALRIVHPSAISVMGGTAVSDVYKYRANSESLLPFKRVCDYLYIGEAETGIAQWAAFCRGECAILPKQVVDLSLPTDAITLQYVSLSERAQLQPRFAPYSWREHPPDYDWVDWDLYLSPEKRVNCSPSRGCFWNQCTFCDYGLNEDGPTAPSRSMDVDTFVAHLAALADRGIRHVYLAVDAIAPNFLSAFADRLIAERLDIHWSSQFFLTKGFNDDLVGRLVASGLRVASFGFESGSSRVLERMGKGKRHVETVFLPVLEVFRRSPVGLQPLFFFGFPGEDDRDRQATVDVLVDHADVFCTVSKGGRFALLPGSMVAKDPERFGVRNLRRAADDDIVGGMRYDLADGTTPPSCDAFIRFNRQLPHLDLFERPWAGGIDTFHTQLYIERHGRDVFHRIRAQRRSADGPWGDVTLFSHFDLDELMENVVIATALDTARGQEQLMQQLPDIDRARLLSELEPLFCRRHPRRHHVKLRLYHEPAEQEAPPTEPTDASAVAPAPSGDCLMPHGRQQARAIVDRPPFGGAHG